MSNSLKKKHSFIYTYIHSTNIEKTLLFSIDKNKHLGFFFCLTTKKRHGLKDLCVFFSMLMHDCVFYFSDARLMLLSSLSRFHRSMALIYSSHVHTFLSLLSAYMAQKKVLTLSSVYFFLCTALAIHRSVYLI